MTTTRRMTLAERARRGLRRRTDGLDDDRGSLPMALLLIMIGLALSAALLPTLIVQDRATVFDATRADNLAAAQAGIDVVVGEIRAATTVTDGITSGNALALPCATTRPITGLVNGSAKALYSVLVSYYVLDPVANPTASPMVCIAGSGVYDSVTGAYVPSYAKIVSTGTDGITPGGGGSTGRTISSTYVFKTSTINIPSGVIRVTPSGTTLVLCMDVGAATPAAGGAVVLATCSATTPPASQQLFAYRRDLTIQLASSVTAANQTGLCLDFNTGTTNPAPAGVAGNAVHLAQCQALDSPPYSQQWSYNDNGQYQASVATSSSTGALSSQCIGVTTQAIAAPLVLNGCSTGWYPSPSVGAGGAKYPQLINFQQFGRCLDIFNQQVYSTKEIAYPCKQNPQLPYPTAVTWNQKFTFDPTTGWIYVTYPGGTQYCLYSPRTEAGFVRLTQCSNLAWVATSSNPAPAPVAAQLQWTQPGNTTATPYAKRYTFVDSSTDATRCLSIIAPTDGNTWFYVDTATCNGSTAQKWNADPSLAVPSLQNITETLTNTSGG